VSPDRSEGLPAGESDLVRDLYPKLRRFAAVVAPAEVEPDDLVQEALVKTLHSHRLSDLAHPSAYLWRVMCSLATDHRRVEGRRRLAMTRLGPPEPYTEAYPSDLVELEMLKPQARAVLYLHDVEGLPYRDVAAVLGGREASMRRAASRARRSLRRVLSGGELDATA
jgi:RNA polymerase sigma factor (sigma-70 family)